MIDGPVVDVRASGKARVPPGQSITRKWPVLHYGDVPAPDMAAWRFRVGGLVERSVSLTYAELTAMPHQVTLCDVHCVTRWSKLDNAFEGIPVSLILERVQPRSVATHVLVRSEEGFTTNLPLGDLDRPENLLAWRHDGNDLTPEHGWPLRLVIPHLYFWKSAKWVRGFELLDRDQAGFWERNGYHMHGDPWKEERHSGPDIDQRSVNTFRNSSKT